MGFAGAALVGAAAGAAVSTLVGGGLIGAILGGVASNLVTNALSPKPKSQDFSYTQRESGIQANVTSTVEPLPVVYGTRSKVGGVICFMETSGTDNEYLHIVLAICEGEIDSFQGVYLNDVISSDAKFSGYVNVYTHTGADDQAADANLVAALPSKWTSNHRLRGVAYIYVRLKYSNDVFPGGIPLITCALKGRKVYNPETTLTAWSDNPVICLRDYLTNTRFGAGIPSSSLLDSSFITGADYCDELVDGRKRYHCNGVLLTGRPRMACVNELLSSCFASLAFVSGIYELMIFKSETPAFTFDEDNIIGEWAISPSGKRGRFNRIKAYFTNEDNRWQPDIFIADDTSARADDNGLMLETDMHLPFTTSVYDAALLAWRMLRESRLNETVSFTATLEALKTKAGEVVYLTHSTPGYVNQTFRIQRIFLRNDGLVQVSAKKYAAAVYADEIVTAPTLPSALTLKDALTIAAPTGLTADVDAAFVQPDGSVVPRMLISWTAPADTFLYQYELGWKRDGVSEPWTSVVLPSTMNSYTVFGVLASTIYNLRIKSINTSGVTSAYATNNSGSVVGDTVAPAAPTSLVGTGVIEGANLVWGNPADEDLAYIEVWEATTNNRASASKIAESNTNYFNRAGLVAGATRYYWVRGVDASGNLGAWSNGETAGVSVTATSVVVADGSITETKIADDAISTPKLQANAVTAVKISVTDLSAIKADMGDITAGNITLGTADSGFIRGGSTGYLTGTGFWMGYVSSAWKFHIGNPSGNYLAWDGSSLTLKGNLYGGMTDYATGTGFFLGYSGAAYKFSVGDTTNYLRWDGSTLSVGGSIIATGNIVSAAATQMVTSNTDGSITCTIGSWVTVASLSITTTGYPVELIAAATLSFGGSVYGFYGIKILRGSTVIYRTGGTTDPPLQGNGVYFANSMDISLPLVDSPSAGTYTYYFQIYAIYSSGGGNPSAYWRKLSALEIKR